MGSHTEFILSPTTEILKDVVSASAGIGSGIETYPLCDYVMQSAFLKMTGFQEQKMKCITWELATVDFDYRRALLGNDDNLGECSSYSDKNKIYKRLMTQIRKHDPSFDLASDIDRKAILKETLAFIKSVFENTNLAIWAQSNFSWFLNQTHLIKPEHFLHQDGRGRPNLFENVLQDKYEVLYNHRNRIAHNTHSYQQNLPTLKALINDGHKYENYFLYFSILLLIDNIFRALYLKYLDAIEDSVR